MDAESGMREICIATSLTGWGDTLAFFFFLFDLSSTCRCGLYTFYLNSSVPICTPAELASVPHSANLQKPRMEAPFTKEAPSL